MDVCRQIGRLFPFAGTADGRSYKGKMGYGRKPEKKHPGADRPGMCATLYILYVLDYWLTLER